MAPEPVHAGMGNAGLLNHRGFLLCVYYPGFLCVCTQQSEFPVRIWWDLSRNPTWERCLCHPQLPISRAWLQGCHTGVAPVPFPEHSQVTSDPVGPPEVLVPYPRYSNTLWHIWTGTDTFPLAQLAQPVLGSVGRALRGLP